MADSSHGSANETCELTKQITDSGCRGGCGGPGGRPAAQRLVTVSPLTQAGASAWNQPEAFPDSSKFERLQRPSSLSLRTVRAAEAARRLRAAGSQALSQYPGRAAIMITVTRRDSAGRLAPGRTVTLARAAAPSVTRPAGRLSV